MSQRNQVRQLQRVPDGFKISDFDNCVLPVVSAMVAYHPFMDKARQVGSRCGEHNACMFRDPTRSHVSVSVEYTTAARYLA